MSDKHNDTEKVMAGLKDFQRKTVDYVFRRFYEDQNPIDRFLVADEVGLGKTLVAKGIIAKAIEHLKAQGIRVDIVYICSNISIASQNINRLNVSGVQEFVRPTRLTMLPMQLADIRKNKINYVSLTPGTSFDPKSRQGHSNERALIYHLLKDRLPLQLSGLRYLLQCTVSKDNWKKKLKYPPENIDPKIAKEYARSIKRDRKFYHILENFCKRSKHRILMNDPDRLYLVSELRLRLAEISVVELEPDLVILDEFQRFRNLLDENNPEARIAQKLFNYPGVKTLLLSATPYKMLSLDYEQEDDHHKDFLDTLRFLYDSDEVVAQVRRELQVFRSALYSFGENEEGNATRVRNSLQEKLLQVMCRTERVRMTRAQDSMLQEILVKPELVEEDLHEAAFADSVAAHVGARDIVEYWKSTPYLINFLKRYEFRTKVEKHGKKNNPELSKTVSKHSHRMLRKIDIQNYKKITPANPRMRHLFEKTLDKGLWKILWLPPSLPYSQPGGDYEEVQDATKSLIFSAWAAVPDAIAALCSYEAERRMFSMYHQNVRKIRHDRLSKKMRPLLRFSRGKKDRFTGMPVLLLMYPSPTLASCVDPLRIALSNGNSAPVSTGLMLEKVEEIITPLVYELTKKAPKGGLLDQRWYWAVPALLDGKTFEKALFWMDSKNEGWPSLSMDGDNDRGLRFREHLENFSRAMENEFNPPLGRPPEDLIQIVSLMAVAGPGTCTLRALKRLAPGLSWDTSELLTAAVTTSEGFRTLFNIPETIALLQGKDQHTPYWQLALNHCMEGNIQSLLDEQVHCLLESLGMKDKSETNLVNKIGTALGESLSIRTALLHLDEVRVQRNKQKLRFTSYTSRCRFALRFGDLKEQEDSSVRRADVVLKAFNSPFRPFVLASTSVGQEGLDFHTWCHAVTHWNLPKNPVDLEQREGRIHRYKGHAIRKNIAKAYGLKALHDHWDDKGDPWHCMFELAKRDRSTDTNDLVPYWIFEVKGGAKIERHVPILPFSREEGQFERLKKMLAIYRLVFGQPRQEDLLHYLADKAEENPNHPNLDAWRITLEPPG
ncbi:MAG: helicase [Candidatus Hydrogenedentes bacterium]|nr:helicase [Candidatus Hydrogenedentota bacterium]